MTFVQPFVGFLQANNKLLALDDVTNVTKAKDGQRLNDLLENSQLVLGKYQEPPRSPELEKRIQQLKNQQADFEYQQMVENVSTTGHVYRAQLNIGRELRAVNKQLITVLNCVLTVACAFVFGYFVPGILSTEADSTQKLICGFVVAGIVFIADAYFLITRTI